MAQLSGKHLDHFSIDQWGKQQRSVTYSMDGKEEVIISLLCVSQVQEQLLLIHVEGFEISDAPQKPNKSI